MTERVATADAAAAAFRTLADAEGARAPTYARICRVIADEPALHELLLLAPQGQRLPVLLLGAIHDVVLREPFCALRPWYPSVSSALPSTDDPTDALRTVVAEHRDEIVDIVTTRQVQTNEVNRSVAWRIALSELCADDDRELALVEVGASAGLNLRLDDYAYRIGDDAELVGRTDSPVRLGTSLRAGDWPEATRPIPPVVTRVGLDQHPLDVTDPDDARWLEACTWPEQRLRFERLSAAISVATDDPPQIVRGDVVDDIGALLGRTPDGAHVVVLASWVLAYVERQRRAAFFDRLRDSSAAVVARGGRLTLLTLDAEHVLPWMEPPPLDAGAVAELRHASILAATQFGAAGVDVRPIARCQAHLAWTDRL